ncbi:MAG: DUF1177 domain-containing protein [Oscillibacter sp.]|jgi:hypothetical protein|nr:DUF1177 domain-containing protein [Oscillibacter sp.]
MLIKQVIELFDLLDRPDASGQLVKKYMEKLGGKDITVRRMEQNGNGTDFVQIVIPGSKGKRSGGTAPSLGVIGRLGGLGARPEMTGFVSDGDGALSALTLAAKVLEMNLRGDFLEGDLYICTHVCPNAPTLPHKPVPFMGSPVDMAVMNTMEVMGEMDAVLSIDTTRGNRIVNHCGIAISPTVKEGYILRISDDLLDIMETTTGEHPYTFAITIQDITPYGNGLYHLNSILQPCTATSAPVVGVAITAESMVPGCASGASHYADVESAARFALEVAKSFGKGACRFYSDEEFAVIQKKYGSMSHVLTMGR